MLAELLEGEGIDIRTGVQAQSVAPASGQTRITLSDGSIIEAERLLVATGRRPRVEGIGLEKVGVEHDGRGIKIDHRCRAAPGVWAVGDVTGIAPFTHVAAYQARLTVADIQGRDVRADYRAIPRVVFSDPEVAAVGLTPEQADEAGLDTEVVTVGLDEVDRTETYGRDLSGCLGLLADRSRQVLVGAWAVGPLAGEWIHTAVLAIKGRCRWPCSATR